MKLSTVHYLCWMSVALAAATSGEAWAVSVSKSELAKMEEQVEKQSIEHRKLQAQATQINLELTSVSREMIKAAKLIQNNEEKLSRMETQLEKLKADLKTAEEGFTEEDDNLIKMLSALQNLALKPTEALFVQPLTPVEIIRSAMLLRETVPYLEENAERIRKELDAIARKKNLVEKQFQQISKQRTRKNETAGSAKVKNPQCGGDKKRTRQTQYGQAGEPGTGFAGFAGKTGSTATRKTAQRRRKKTNCPTESRRTKTAGSKKS